MSETTKKVLETKTASTHLPSQTENLKQCYSQSTSGLYPYQVWVSPKTSHGSGTLTKKLSTVKKTSAHNKDQKNKKQKTKTEKCDDRIVCKGDHLILSFFPNKNNKNSFRNFVFCEKEKNAESHSK